MATKILCATLMTLVTTAAASASPLVPPPGLGPGDFYYLVFITKGGVDGRSSDILFYDAFVRAEAISVAELAALDTTWKVIGSTATQDAVTHVAVDPITHGLLLGAPIYNLAGQRVAGGFPDLFDGLLDFPIDLNPNGETALVGSVWTGSRFDGTLAVGQGLGTSNDPNPPACPSGGCTRIGFPHATDKDWLDGSFALHAPTDDRLLPIYGISGPLRFEQCQNQTR